MPSFPYPTATISETILSVIRTGECVWCHDQRRLRRLLSVGSLVAPPFGPFHVPGAMVPDREHGSMAEVTSSSYPQYAAPTQTPPRLPGPGG
jgi:hypothetical protein